MLVNDAAIPGVRHITRTSPADVERVMQVNFHAPVRLSLAFMYRMLERGSGTIVNVSSLGGRLGIPKRSAYCASKFALCGWTESLALDLWSTPIGWLSAHSSDRGECHRTPGKRLKSVS